MVFHILQAEVDDFSELTDICISVKKHWGYPDYLIELWKDELTITPRYIRNNGLIKVQDGAGKILGFGSICANGNQDYFEIPHLWVLPEFSDKNLGKILIGHLERRLKEKATIKVIADPNMVAFFQKYGYHKVGELRKRTDGMNLSVLKKILTRSSVS